MNFIVKQYVKSKTGGITDKLGEATKKCKDLLEEKEEPPPPPPTLSEEERAEQEVSVN